jgi:hypothetical protein
MSALAFTPYIEVLDEFRAFGKAGDYVWANSKEIQDEDERLEYLKDAIVWLTLKLAEKGKWRETPVDFRTFVEHASLLNKRNILYPEVMRCGIEMNSGRYVEAVLTGGIGVGKTHLSIYSMAYQVYLLSCMANPHKMYGLDPASFIVMIFQSINKNLAMDVDYRAFREVVEHSPYFENHYRFDHQKLSEMAFPNSLLIKPVSGAITASIGQNVIGGILDEVNFMAVIEESKLSRDGSVFDQAAANYNSIARRRESRFMKMGVLPGLLCLVSSKNYPGGLTDRKVEEARTNKLIYVYEKRVWDIKPYDFKPERFRVFAGDPTRHPRILTDEDVVPEADERLVIEVPYEYRFRFENNLIDSIRDIAGFSTQALHPFILNTEAVNRCFGSVKSILSRDDADFKVTFLKGYPDFIQNREEPRFAHVDLSQTRDSTGVAMGHVPGFKMCSRGVDGWEKLPIIQFDFLLEVKPPAGGEILLENVRSVIYKCRENLHLDVRWVSFDAFQSSDSKQLMALKGFSTGHQSVDKTTMPYDLLKQALYDGRVIAPKHEKALRELCTLEFDAKHQKVDHPPQGSKDISDAMAGVVYGLTMRSATWINHGVETREAPSIMAAVGADQVKQQANTTYVNTMRGQRGVGPLETDDGDF